LARRSKKGRKTAIKRKIKGQKGNMYCILAALLVKSFKKYAKRA
jgi:hypothetical protein